MTFRGTYVGSIQAGTVRRTWTSGKKEWGELCVRVMLDASTDLSSLSCPLSSPPLALTS